MATATGIVPDVDPGEIGLDPERLQRLERHLQREYVDSGRRVGTLTVIARGGKIGWVSALGRRDADNGLPVETDTIWRIYSMTKPLTSVAAMILWEEGLLSLRDPVAKFIPAFADSRVYRMGAAAAPITAPAAETMTVWHLLTHTSGLTYSFMFRDPVDEAYRNAGFAVGGYEEYTLEHLCDTIGRLPLLFEPGTRWNYSYSTDVLARVVEIVSGRTIEQFFRERIAEPLGMHDTGFTIPESEAPRLAALYSLDPTTGRARFTPEEDRSRTEPRPFMGGGHGLVSTAADYHRFAQMLLRGGELDGVRLLSPRTVELMTANHLPGGADIPSLSLPSPIALTMAGRGFGLGFATVIDPVRAQTLSSPGEFSWGGAAGTEFWVDPQEELTVVFMTQVLWAVDDLRAEMRRLVYQSLIQ